MRAAAVSPVRRMRAQCVPGMALLLALAAVAVTLPQPAASAQLPLHLQWLASILPPDAVGPALKDFFKGMPTELCALGPKGISELPVSVMDEVCPLKAASRLGRAVPVLHGSNADAAIERLAAKPVTIGGALMLLAADDAAGAADLQKRICNVLLYPQQVCAFGSSSGGGADGGSKAPGSAANGGAAAQGSDGSAAASAGGGADPPAAADADATSASDGLGPLYRHLEEQLPVQEWLASKVMPLALAPLGGTLAALPDALCKLPLDNLSNMPPKIKAQMCPYDVALVPVLALFAMGRTRSGELESKLCDIFKRPAEACINGTYQINDSTRKRIDNIKALGVSAVYSWEPDVPELPKLSFPSIDLASPTSRDNLGKLASWWQNETMPTLRRYTMAAFVPPPLQAPVASLLERLPASICASIGRKQLPFAFKREVCPISDVLQLKAGQGINSWAYTLAEVTIGAAGGGANSSESGKARVDAWLMRTCSAVYAPELACAQDVAGRGQDDPDEGTMELLGQRIAARGPVSAELVRRSLDGMPEWQRKRLVDGVAKQLNFWSARAKLLPKAVAASMFGPFCGTNDTEAAAADKPQAIASLVAAAATVANDAVQPLPALGAIVGDERARAAVAKLCDSLKPPPPPPPPRTPWGRAGAWVKGALPSWAG